MNILDPLPEAKILSLLLTLRCTAACSNCGTHSSPRVKVRLDHATARSLIDQAAAEGYQLVVFTGGEPMLYGDELLELVRHAAELRLSSRMVTNAFWARSSSKAAAAVAGLRAAGLTEINFSTGDQHARFVPVANVIRATRASIDHGLPVSIMIETTRDQTVTRDAVVNDPLYRELISAAETETINFCESPWMPLDPSEIEAYPSGLAVSSDNLDQRTGCDSVIGTMTVLADGRMMACCGLGTQTIPELEVGHVEHDSLAAVRERARDDFLKRWIRAEGPERILAWAATKDPSIAWEDMYAHRCQACARLYGDEAVRKVVRDHYEEKILDVLVSEWLMHEYRPEEGALVS